jgi:hypothetical protein
MEDSMSDRKRTVKGFVVVLINLVTAFSLAVTAISPRQIINLTSSIASQSVMENQPLLQFYSSISMIPINMVSKMFGEKFTGIKNTVKNKTHEKNDNNRACSDFSFALPDSSSNLLKTQNLQSLPFFTPQDRSLAMQVGCQFRLLTAGPSQCIIFLCILLFLITLRRRSLPAPYINNIIYLINPILVAKRIGFFNLRRVK